MCMYSDTAIPFSSHTEIVMNVYKGHAPGCLSQRCLQLPDVGSNLNNHQLGTG